MKKDVRLLINSCEHLDRALRGVLRNLEPDDQHVLLECRADRVPLWNFARSRDAFSRLRAAGLLELDRFTLTQTGALVAEALAQKQKRRGRRLKLNADVRRKDGCLHVSYRTDEGTLIHSVRLPVEEMNR